jgi:hypothetical protein
MASSHCSRNDRPQTVSRQTWLRSGVALRAEGISGFSYTVRVRIKAAAPDEIPKFL